MAQEARFLGIDLTSRQETPAACAGLDQERGHLAFGLRRWRWEDWGAFQT
ncbi:MAG: hypothetical protein HYU86_07610 [Chloroflexi bacterium]|nr:hypothetical protein [Chloroflexota bacterium]